MYAIMQKSIASRLVDIFLENFRSLQGLCPLAHQFRGVGNPFFLREKKGFPNLPKEKRIFYISTHRVET